MASLVRNHTEYAYAKINTFLAVTSRRADGYHELVSHMQALTLCDVLNMSWQSDHAPNWSFTLHCDDASLPCDNTNLVFRAVMAMRAYLNAKNIQVHGCLEIHLQKRIPMAAGLAGGSADAAAALRGFNALLDHPLTMDELCSIGASLGADIPFCLMSETHHSMTARGVGEVLSEAVSLPDHCFIVVACDGEGVSTPWAFRRLDELGKCATNAPAEQAYADLSSAMASGNLSRIAACSYNCFEGVVLPERPAARALMDTMKEGGAVFARMSGSGPSVIGYFDDEDKAAACATELSARGVRAYLAKPLSEKI